MRKKKSAYKPRTRNSPRYSTKWRCVQCKVEQYTSDKDYLPDGWDWSMSNKADHEQGTLFVTEVKCYRCKEVI